MARIIHNQVRVHNVKLLAYPFFSVILIILLSCCEGHVDTQKSLPETSASLMVVGVAQDAGYPQIQCKKACCVKAFANCEMRQMVSCLALIDYETNVYFLLDATPDLKFQMKLVEEKTGATLGGILLTHAHMGHYTGLMNLGREAMGSENISVYAMPRMSQFLRENGPWSQLVSLKNIELQKMSHDSVMQLSPNLWISPYLVPHRDEYSETVGFKIRGPNRKGWFIPDIDKWSKWDIDLNTQFENDFFFLDGTFYQNGEIFGRDMSEIPHPFIQETMTLLEEASESNKSKIHFIHFNHTNPAMWDTQIRREIIDSGFRLAEEGLMINL